MTESESSLVPIRAVCAMYNLNPNTLRTWERRYGIITPKRSEGGQRAYGREDLENIQSMLALIHGGLTPAEAASRLRAPRRQKAPAIPAGASGLKRRLRDAVKRLDAAEAMKVCRESISDLGYEAAVETVLFPELNHWGHLWEMRGPENAVAHEHLATLAVRAMLLDFRTSSQNGARAKEPAVTLSCVPGEAHDLPILHLANVMGAAKIGRPVVLVAGLPLEEVLDASHRVNARAIVLSATLIPRSAVVRSWIDMVAQRGWEERTILVGPGFARSRVYSRMRVKAGAGGYHQVVEMLKRILTDKDGR